MSVLTEIQDLSYGCRSDLNGKKMNVFVLCTGRSGSMTFAKACESIDNFSSGHESRIKFMGRDRVDYPDQHIEVDNRLIWFSGLLEEQFGQKAYYVHLMRNPEAVAKSLNQRWNYNHSIIRAYAETILFKKPEAISDNERLAVCHDYIATVNNNITNYLRDKPNKMTIHLEKIEEQFPAFWKWIRAEGYMEAAINSLNVRHNKDTGNAASNNSTLIRRLNRKLFKK